MLLSDSPTRGGLCENAGLASAFTTGFLGLKHSVAWHGPHRFWLNEQLEISSHGLGRVFLPQTRAHTHTRTVIIIIIKEVGGNFGGGVFVHGLDGGDGFMVYIYLV